MGNQRVTSFAMLVCLRRFFREVEPHVHDGLVDRDWLEHQKLHVAREQLLDLETEKFWAGECFVGKTPRLGDIESHSSDDVVCYC